MHESEYKVRPAADLYQICAGRPVYATVQADQFMAIPKNAKTGAEDLANEQANEVYPVSVSGRPSRR